MLVYSGSAWAQAQGTLNNDYFNPRRDHQWLEYIGSIEYAHVKPGLIAFAQGDMRGTLAQLEYVLPRTVNHPQMLSLASMYAIRTKNPMWAKPHFERALSLYPQYALTHAQYGKYLVDIGIIDAGMTELNRALEIDPKLVAGHVFLAAAYTKTGQKDLARESAQRARDLGYTGKLIE
jgi:Tfp pilus assembly protein PilF